jgi:4-hydroxy-2-oxoglutarate aldolase
MSRADVLCVLPRSFYGTQLRCDDLRPHYETVPDASPVPVILCEASKYANGVSIPMTVVLDFARHERMFGLKDSSSSRPVALSAELWAVDYAGVDSSVLSGSINTFVPALVAGAVRGAVSPANMLPRDSAEVYRLAESGDWTGAARSAAKLIGVTRAVAKRYGIGGVKASMELLGLPGRKARAPLSRVDEQGVQVLRALLQAEGFLA